MLGTVWHYRLMKKIKKSSALKKVVALEPSHQKALQLLEQLHPEQKSPVLLQEKAVKSVQPSTQRPASKNLIKKDD